MNQLIALVEYDQRWPDAFEAEARRVKATLGGRALEIEHVGSTSVPWLIAKPVIDVLLVVANSADEPAYVQDLERALYVLRIREPDWYEHRMLKGPEGDVNLHVFSAGCEEVERMLRFRDHLRSNQRDRQLYAEAKCELSKRQWQSVQEYADAKTPIVEAILQRAAIRG